MINRYVAGIFLCSLYCMSAWSNDSTEFVQIRRATAHDLAAALELDRAVTFEFFKPLYETHYAHLPHGKDADHFLTCELAADEQYFIESLDDKSPRRLLVAEDMSNNAIVGLLLIHREQDIIEIDLLMVDQQYCKKSMGGRLVGEALRTFDGITACVVYLLCLGNEERHAFYESLGFVREEIAPGKQDLYGVDYTETRCCYKRAISAN